MNDELKAVFESLHSAIVFDSMDWSADKRKAWIYGIVVGWDKESLAGFKARFGWTDEAITRLNRLHDEAIKHIRHCSY